MKRAFVLGVAACVAAFLILHRSPMKTGDRILVLRGPHAGRHGTITVVAGENATYDKYLELKDGELRIGLDGEPGQIASGPGAYARGGRGGITVSVPVSDVTIEP